jgi:hypothetical protein
MSEPEDIELNFYVPCKYRACSIKATVLKYDNSVSIRAADYCDSNCVYLDFDLNRLNELINGLVKIRDSGLVK